MGNANKRFAGTPAGSYADQHNRFKISKQKAQGFLSDVCGGRQCLNVPSRFSTRSRSRSRKEPKGSEHNPEEFTTGLAGAGARKDSALGESAPHGRAQAVSREARDGLALERIFAKAGVKCLCHGRAVGV